MLYTHQFDGYDLHQRNVYFVKSIVVMRCGGELDRDVLYYNSPNLNFLEGLFVNFFLYRTCFTINGQAET